MKPLVVVVGLGPAGPELTTPAAVNALAGAPLAFVRTRQHPSAEPFRHLQSFDDLYERSSTFEEVYRTIVERLVGAATEHGHVAYAVPGSPFVAERTVDLLRADQRIALRLVPALSFCELAWAAAGVDPVAAAVRIADATAFTAELGRFGLSAAPLLLAQTWSRQVLSDVKLSLELDPDTEVLLLHHLGLADEQVVRVPWSEIDKTLAADHLTSLYIPQLPSSAGYELDRLDHLVATLRERCPWDREQTHRSLLRHLLEEAHEALEAIDALGDPPTAEQAAHLEEELGDLLCQVYFHCRLATEEGLFDLAAVARTLHDKLVARHPHVFGDVLADSSAAVVSRWERRKLDEKGRDSLMDGIPASMPTLAVVGKVERRAEGAGLGYEETVDESSLEPALEELISYRRAGSPPPQLETLLGTLLVAVARLGAHLGADPEAAARRAVSAFREQFARAEAAALARGTRLHDLPGGERLELFRAAALPAPSIPHC